MVILQNDTVTAQQHATALIQGVHTLLSIGTVIKDDKTTLSGNSDASSAIDLSQSIATQVANTLVSMSQNLQNVSETFQAMDFNLGQKLGNLESSKEFSLNEPR